MYVCMYALHGVREQTLQAIVGMYRRLPHVVARRGPEDSELEVERHAMLCSRHPVAHPLPEVFGGNMLCVPRGQMLATVLGKVSSRGLSWQIMFWLCACLASASPKRVTTRHPTPRGATPGAADFAASLPQHP